jgi:hypothetical protein
VRARQDAERTPSVGNWPEFRLGRIALFVWGAEGVNRALRFKERLAVAGAARVVEQPVTVAAAGQRSDLVAGQSDEVALADEPFVALCRFARYAEGFPGSRAERRRRARKIGITLGRPGNETPRLTVWRA